MSEISDMLRESADDMEMNPGVAQHFSLQLLRRLADRIDAEMVELPRGKDGRPIHVGDTVYLDDGRKAKVARIQLSEREHSIGFTVCGDFFALWPEDITHTCPDSWERIAYDIETVVPIDDEDDERLRRELARRIRRLAEREGK